MYTAYTSSLGGKYFIGVSTAGGIGAKKVAKELANDFVVGFHQHGHRTGYVYAYVGNDTIKDHPKKLTQAYQLGIKLVQDFEKQKQYHFQKILNKLLIHLIVKRMIIKNITENKEGMMKAVYQNLLNRGLIQK
jgi:hypothetical protein